MLTSEKVYKRTIKITELPQIFYLNGHKYMIQLRGQECFTIRALDEFKYQYRCMQRIVSDSPVGLIETLSDTQKYERFKTMEECEAHFYKVEEGAPLMLPVKIT